MPPSDASAPGSIGKKSPVWRISLLSCMRVTPACTVAVRSSACTDSTRFMRDRSMLTPPCTASRCPSSDEPAPYGMTGTACRCASATTAATSSVLSQYTTASGGGTSKGDSSRPCCSRTASAVEQRSPKRSRRSFNIVGRHRAHVDVRQYLRRNRCIHRCSSGSMAPKRQPRMNPPQPSGCRGSALPVRWLRPLGGAPKALRGDIQSVRFAQRAQELGAMRERGQLRAHCEQPLASTVAITTPSPSSRQHEHLAPRVDDHAVAPGAAAVLVASALRRRRSRSTGSRSHARAAAVPSARGRWCA